MRSPQSQTMIHLFRVRRHGPLMFPEKAWGPRFYFQAPERSSRRWYFIWLSRLKWMTTFRSTSIVFPEPTSFHALQIQWFWVVSPSPLYKLTTLSVVLSRFNINCSECHGYNCATKYNCATILRQYYSSSTSIQSLLYESYIGCLSALPTFSPLPLLLSELCFC